MISKQVLQRFAEHSPITVMARIGLECALDAKLVDELFEQRRGSQCIRELLSSTTVEVMSLGALGLRPSIHAAAKKMKGLPGYRPYANGFALSITGEPLRVTRRIDS